ncbi:seipin-like isoform X2 [Planococcus citri]|uniref:seipin-like isoform X2 n=1 Tax=Planococcus citri TaxID=170843 RepID=UPI0031F77FBD
MNFLINPIMSLLKAPSAMISNRVANVKLKVNQGVDNAFEHAFRGGMFSLIMLTLVWISVFIYVVFYYAYVPAPSYMRPVHLQVEPCEDLTKECTYPSAHVRLTRRQQLLMMGQPYKFYVHLEMPESPINKQLGMFMVCIQLTDRKGFLTSQACRSNMLHYESDLLNQVKVILLSPFYVFGAKEEKQTLVFELFSDFEEDQNHPVTDVYVEVQARNIEIYSASLLINAHLSGMRYFMYHWPVTSSILGISFNLCIVFFTTTLSFYNRFFVDTAAVKAVRALSKKFEDKKDRFDDMFSKPDSSGVSEPKSEERRDKDGTDESSEYYLD